MSARINRSVLQRIRMATMPPLQSPTGVRPMLQHPHRALPQGYQYNGLDKADGSGKAAARRRKQARALELKRLRKQFGSNTVSGVEADGALVLDFPGPDRATESQ